MSLSAMLGGRVIATNDAAHTLLASPTPVRSNGPRPSPVRRQRWCSARHRGRACTTCRDVGAGLSWPAGQAHANLRRPRWPRSRRGGHRFLPPRRAPVSTSSRPG